MSDEFEVLVNRALGLTGVKKTNDSSDSVVKVQDLAKPNKSSFVVKDSITTGAIIGFFISIFGFLWSKNMISWFIQTDSGIKLDLANEGLQFFLWMVFWTVLVILGVDNKSVTEYGLDLLKILGDDGLSTQAKFEQIRTLTQVLMQKMTDKQLHIFRNKLEQKIDNTTARSHIIVRQNVSTGIFFCYVCALIGFAWVKEIIVWGDFNQSGFQLTLWMAFWTTIMVMGVEKGSVVQFALNMLKVLGNDRLNMEQKYGLVRQVVQQWIGVMADMSQILELEKQASTDSRSISKIIRTNQKGTEFPKLDETLSQEKQEEKATTVFTQIKRAPTTPFVADNNPTK